MSWECRHEYGVVEYCDYVSSFGFTFVTFAVRPLGVFAVNDKMNLRYICRNVWVYI